MAIHLFRIDRLCIFLLITNLKYERENLKETISHDLGCYIQSIKLVSKREIPSCDLARGQFGKPSFLEKWNPLPKNLYYGNNVLKNILHEIILEASICL